MTPSGFKEAISLSMVNNMSSEARSRRWRPLQRSHIGRWEQRIMPGKWKKELKFDFNFLFHPGIFSVLPVRPLSMGHKVFRSVRPETA